MKKIIFSLALIASPWLIAQESSPTAEPASTETTAATGTDAESKAAEATPSASPETTAAAEASPTGSAEAVAPVVEAFPSASAEPSSTANDEQKPTEQASGSDDPEAVTKTFLEAIKNGNCEVIIANVELNKDEKEEEVMVDCKKDIDQLKRSLESVKEFKISKGEVSDNKAVINVQYLDEQGKEVKEADKFPLVKTDKGWKTSF